MREVGNSASQLYTGRTGTDDSEGEQRLLPRRIHLALAYGLRIAPQGLAYRNRLVLIGPDGRMVWRYDKAHPVPGYEARHMQPGSAPIARAATSLGILAGAICYDGDHEMVLEDIGVGIRFKGRERTDVEEYSVSEGWIRVQVGKTVDRKGQPLTIKLSGEVEPYFADTKQSPDQEPAAEPATDADSEG